MVQAERGVILRFNQHVVTFLQSCRDKFGPSGRYLHTGDRVITPRNVGLLRVEGEELGPCIFSVSQRGVTRGGGTDE